MTNTHKRHTHKTGMVIAMLLLILTACGTINEGDSVSSSANIEAAPAQPTYDVATLERGESLFGIFCTACHGPDAKGLPGLGLNLTTSEFVKTSDDAELIKFVIQGRAVDHPDNTTGKAMPPRGGFPSMGDAQITSIIAYIRTLEE